MFVEEEIMPSILNRSPVKRKSKMEVSKFDWYIKPQDRSTFSYCVPSLSIIHFRQPELYDTQTTAYPGEHFCEHSLSCKHGRHDEGYLELDQDHVLYLKTSLRLYTFS